MFHSRDLVQISLRKRMLYQMTSNLKFPTLEALSYWMMNKKLVISNLSLGSTHNVNNIEMFLSIRNLQNFEPNTKTLLYWRSKNCSEYASRCSKHIWVRHTKFPSPEPEILVKYLTKYFKILDLLKRVGAPQIHSGDASDSLIKDFNK